MSRNLKALGAWRLWRCISVSAGSAVGEAEADVVEGIGCEISVSSLEDGEHQVASDYLF